MITDENANGSESDAWTGALRSDTFTVGAGSSVSISLLVGGGNHACSSTTVPTAGSGGTCVNLEQIHDDSTASVFGTFTGTNSDTMRGESWNAVGEGTYRISIYDYNSGGWGHIGVDDIKITSGCVIY